MPGYRSTMTRVRIRYTGRVQGVGFRATCRRLAEGLPVTGFVRNEPDGSVTLEAQGSPEAVQSLLDRVARTMKSNIHRAERTEIPPVESERRFTIAY